MTIDQVLATESALVVLRPAANLLARVFIKEMLKEILAGVDDAALHRAQVYAHLIKVMEDLSEQHQVRATSSGQLPSRQLADRHEYP